ncbi:hypothetical protein DM02DRAFT_617616 [Periconia macrospinosa]|uniref:Uncharacterized protein n=1 Tax=Periconia macrospinosa TaxID=97972 RepID=A0A2V1DCI3_9PLEO|nr:hypothetical protein DM02DRAFT_617616 [Periconia macrospinosa]
MPQGQPQHPQATIIPSLPSVPYPPKTSILLNTPASADKKSPSLNRTPQLANHPLALYERQLS